ncbi:hypothetical protein [Chitinophaga rhizophila]|uniref:Uncharacterized protein n=1 Tax=Chitinophaga rhizophila TaxID=2866212 RepID=A0ABS7G5L4_9BACT|nr:hypothetical protein [Chitinophaga rhizophila]MBW8682928.1 hypothetical protein [Chitinophaga rhizophila]
MARQTSILTFSGRLTNMIGYYRNGKHFLRSIPETVRQTTATRRAAQRFGIASKRGALIRKAFSSGLDVCCDSSHINRLTKTLIKSAQPPHQAVTGFRFNQHTGISRFLRQAPVFMPEGILHIPAQTLPSVKGITGVEVKVIAARISFGSQSVTGTANTTMTIDHNRPFAGADMHIDVPGHGILMVVVQVRGLHDGRPAGHRQDVAADIIAVQLPKSSQVFDIMTMGRTTATCTMIAKIGNNRLSLPAPSCIQRE